MGWGWALFFGIASGVAVTGVTVAIELNRMWEAARSFLVAVGSVVQCDSRVRVLRVGLYLIAGVCSHAAAFGAFNLRRGRWWLTHVWRWGLAWIVRAGGAAVSVGCGGWRGPLSAIIGYTAAALFVQFAGAAHGASLASLRSGWGWSYGRGDGGRHRPQILSSNICGHLSGAAAGCVWNLAGVPAGFCCNPFNTWRCCWIFGGGGGGGKGDVGDDRDTCLHFPRW